MTEDSNAVLDEDSAMTLDQAAELLAERRREPEQDPEPEEEPAALTLPPGWADEDKEAFAALSPAARERLMARETQRRSDEERKERALADQRAAVDRERQAAAAWLAHSLPGMAKAVQDKYAAVDWAKLAKDDAAGYVAKRAEYDADLGRLDAAHRQAEQAAAALATKATQDHRAFVQREQDALAKLVPDLADEAKGPSLKASLRAFAAQAGYTPDQIAWASARDIATLHDAYRWRQAQTRRAEAEKKAAPVVQRPGMATSKGERDAAAYANGLQKLERSGRIEDALALLKMKRRG